MRFLLFAGANNTLASLEIQTQIPGSTQVLPNIYLITADDPKSAETISSRLGCSIKLAQEISNLAPDPERLVKVIKSKTFSVTELTDHSTSAEICHKIKQLLPGSRFVLSKNYFGLTPVLSKKHNIDEFFLNQHDRMVWQTIWVHDYVGWIKKDREAPHTNARAGVLPPKIARSMINLSSADPRGKLLVDPFCGSGRILVEAASLGYTIGGGDIQSKQVAETRENLNFFGFQAQLEVIDAVHLSEKFSKIDLIVTEPFLGKPNFRPDQVRYIVPGLKKLYLGCLKDWNKVLSAGGQVVMVFPVFEDGKHTYKTADLIDDRLGLGYNLLKRGILYSRPGASIKREIVILEKNN